MGTFANPETLFDNSTNGPTVEQALQQMRDNQRAIMELEGAKPTEVCTISTTNINTNGTIYPSSAEVVVTLPENTNSLSAVLTDISPSYERTTGVYEVLHDGMVVSLKSEFSSYQIELVSSETLKLKTAERITLSHLYPLKLKLVLGNNGDYYWEEVPNAGTHSGDITSISGDLDVSGKIRSNGALLEKKLVFDSTPVYDVTLAENTTTPFTLTDTQLGGNFKNVEIYINGTITNEKLLIPVRAYVDANNATFAEAQFTANSGSRINCKVSFLDILGRLNAFVIVSGYSSYSGNVTGYAGDNAQFIGEKHIVKLEIYSIGVPQTIPAGTRITIYAAKEVE